MKMNKIRVSRASDADILIAAEIESRCFSHPWKADDFKNHRDGGLFLVAKLGEDTAGYISITTVLDEAYINTIACDERFRRMGIATSLLNEAAKHLRRQGSAFLTLEVRGSNTPAISLYKKLGFKEVGIRPRFYRDPDEDAILMTLYL